MLWPTASNLTPLQTGTTTYVKQFQVFETGAIINNAAKIVVIIVIIATTEVGE